MVLNGTALPNTPIAVDLWRKSRVPPHTRLFFCSHCHADHTDGLTSTWNMPIYCSEITGKLLVHKLQVKRHLIHSLEIGRSHSIPLDHRQTAYVNVTLIHANHCPGAVMFLFEGYFGTILYTADFRLHQSMFETYPLSEKKRIDVLYLDNTYCNPRCVFPTQHEATQTIIDLMKQRRNEDPDVQFIIGMRMLGKETLLEEIATSLQTYIVVDLNRMGQLELLECRNVFTTNPDKGFVEVMNFKQVTRKKIAVLNETRPTIAILPTALYTGLNGDPYKDYPQIHTVPYSDHSSYAELLEFVEFVRPKKVLPIVKGSSYDRNAVEDMACFDPFLDPQPMQDIIVPEEVQRILQGHKTYPMLSPPSTAISALNKRKIQFRRRHERQWHRKFLVRGVSYSESDLPGKQELTQQSQKSSSDVNDSTEQESKQSASESAELNTDCVVVELKESKSKQSESQSESESPELNTDCVIVESKLSESKQSESQSESESPELNTDCVIVESKLSKSKQSGTQSSDKEADCVVVESKRHIQSKLLSKSSCQKITCLSTPQRSESQTMDRKINPVSKESKQSDFEQSENRAASRKISRVRNISKQSEFKPSESRANQLTKLPSQEKLQTRDDCFVCDVANTDVSRVIDLTGPPKVTKRRSRNEEKPDSKRPKRDLIPSIRISRRKSSIKRKQSQVPQQPRSEPNVSLRRTRSDVLNERVTSATESNISTEEHSLSSTAVLSDSFIDLTDEENNVCKTLPPKTNSLMPKKGVGAHQHEDIMTASLHKGFKRHSSEEKVKVEKYEGIMESNCCVVVLNELEMKKESNRRPSGNANENIMGNTGVIMDYTQSLENRESIQGEYKGSQEGNDDISDVKDCAQTNVNEDIMIGSGDIMDSMQYPESRENLLSAREEDSDVISHTKDGVKIHVNEDVMTITGDIVDSTFNRNVSGESDGSEEEVDITTKASVKTSGNEDVMIITGDIVDSTFNHNVSGESDGSEEEVCIIPTTNASVKTSGDVDVRINTEDIVDSMHCTKTLKSTSPKSLNDTVDLSATESSESYTMERSNEFSNSENHRKTKRKKSAVRRKSYVFSKRSYQVKPVKK